MTIEAPARSKSARHGKPSASVDTKSGKFKVKSGVDSSGRLFFDLSDKETAKAFKSQSTYFSKIKIA